MSTCSETIKKGRGRPKTFDRDDALDKALLLFWQHGFEATSMADLVAATGAKAPTLYAEFENKEGLFRAVMDRYMDSFAEQRARALNCPGKSAQQGIEDFFRTTATCFTDGKKPSGCFIICTSSALAASSSDVARMLHARHHAMEATLHDFLHQRQVQGELAAALDVSQVAEYLACVLQGISVRAREGASTEDVNRIIDTLMRQWPTLIQP